jgi:hypothetical protein
MTISRIASLATLVILGQAACGDDEAGMSERASGMLADSAVIAEMRDTGTVGRIIYDSAPDLSLGSARQRRPDIFRPPAPPATQATARDTSARQPRRP